LLTPIWVPMNVTAVPETRWIGNYIFDHGDYTILHSGKRQGTHELGVAFIIDKRTKKILVKFQPSTNT